LPQKYLVYLKNCEPPSREEFTYENVNYYKNVSFKQVDDIRKDLIYRDCVCIYKDLYFIMSENEITMKLKSASFEESERNLQSIGEMVEYIRYYECENFYAEHLGGEVSRIISLYINKKFKDFKCPAIIEDYVRVLFAENEEEMAFLELSYDHDTYEKYLYVTEKGQIIIKEVTRRFDQYEYPLFKDDSISNDNPLYNALKSIL